jgi:hypothetical protein
VRNAAISVVSSVAGEFLLAKHRACVQVGQFAALLNDQTLFSGQRLARKIIVVQTLGGSVESSSLRHILNMNGIVTHVLGHDDGNSGRI